MTIIGLDPGYAKSGKGCAFALLGCDQELLHASFIRPEQLSRPPFSLCHPAPVIVVVEKPQFDGRTPAAQKTVAELGWQGAAVAYYIAGLNRGTVVEIPPRDWKGSARKPQHHHEIWGFLCPNEKEILGGQKTLREIEKSCERGALDRWRKPGVEYYPRAWITHNLLDAVGLALTYAGRFK